MKEINGHCPRCSQNRLLRSINYMDDRRKGIIISKDGKHIDYLCYKCLDEIDKGIRYGKKFVDLMGNGFIISGYGLHKYLEEIHKELGIDRQIIRKSFDFINMIYGRWVEIQLDDKFKYHLASLITLFFY